MLLQTRERFRDGVHQTREKDAGMGCIKQEKEMQGWGAPNKREIQGWGASNKREMQGWGASKKREIQR